jgi:hypothetical protein
MPNFLRFISATISIGIAAYAVPKLIFLLEQDDCLDSGGALNSAGICEVATGTHYSPLFGPQTPYFVWLMLFGVASIFILGVSRVGLKITETLVAKLSSPS